MYCTKCGTQISDTSTFCSSCGYKIEILSDSKNSNEEIIVSGEIVNTDFKVTSFIKKEKFPTENKVVEIKIEEGKIRTNHPINYSYKKEKTKWNGYTIFLLLFSLSFISLFSPYIFNLIKNSNFNQNTNPTNTKPDCFGTSSCSTNVFDRYKTDYNQVSVKYEDIGILLIVVI